MIGPYYTGQRPIEPMVITVKAQDGNAMDLSDYTTAELILVGPDGERIEDGVTTITNSAAGTVAFVWPAVSILNEPGDYRYQLELSDGASTDYTSTDTFEVYERLGE